MSGIVLTLLVTAGCQLPHTASAGLDVRDAVDELLSREALTMEASFLASPEATLSYLEESAETFDGPKPDRSDADMLAALELTAVSGDSERELPMRDRNREDPLSVALSVGFGGKDAVGIKRVEDETYLRVGADTMVQDALRGAPADVTRAEQFMQRAENLPSALDTAARAMSGGWVLVDPYLYYSYGEALEIGGYAPRDQADRVAAALTDTAPLLEAETQWRLVDGIEDAVGDGAELRETGTERGAKLVQATVSASHAEAALEPLLDLLERQSDRFGLPPVAHDPVDPDAKVNAELEIRNGVLSGITFDLGQFNGEDFAELPLHLDLNGGSAISLTAPDAPMLHPEDLSVALLYLDVQEERRKEDPEQGNIPGPIQP